VRPAPALTWNWLFCDGVAAAIFVGPLTKRTLFLECLKGLVLAGAAIYRSAKSSTVTHVIGARLQKEEVADLANFEVLFVAVEINLMVGCRAAKRGQLAFSVLQARPDWVPGARQCMAECAAQGGVLAFTRCTGVDNAHLP
jgi:hypothetical protein